MDLNFYDAREAAKPPLIVAWNDTFRVHGYTSVKGVPQFKFGIATGAEVRLPMYLFEPFVRYDNFIVLLKVKDIYVACFK